MEGETRKLSSFMAARHMSSYRAPSLRREMLHEIEQCAFAEFEDKEPLVIKKQQLQHMFQALIELNERALADLAKVDEP